MDMIVSKTSELIEEYLLLGKFPRSTLDVVMNHEKHYLGELCSRGHDYCNTGSTVRAKSHGNCMICMKMNAFVWRRENIDRARASDKAQTDSGRAAIRKATSRAAVKKFNSKPTSTLYNISKGIIQRSRVNGIPCDIDYEDILQLFSEQRGKCYWTGVDIDLIGPPRHPTKPSVDRLIPELGYVKGNIVIASNFINRARSDCDHNVFKSILDDVMKSYQKLP